MQLIKIVLHGFLKDRYESFAVAASTPAEALEGWGRQVGMDKLPIDRKPLIQVVDHETEEKLRAPTDAKELHLVPAMFGGGGGIGKIVVGALFIAASFIPGIGQAVQIALISTGLGLAVGGVMELFMKQPTIKKSQDPEASKYIGTGRMTTAIGTLIPMGGGRMLIGGQILSLQVDSNTMVHGVFPATPT